jgi:hypothetical protein
MKFKTVCASIAVATSMTTGMIFVPQVHTLAQNSPTQTEQTNSRASRSLEIQWLFGFIPWFRTRNSSSPRTQNLGNRTTYANNRNNSIPKNHNNANRPKIIGTKQKHNSKEVPVPVLIPGLTALGAGLIRKQRQEQKQMEMK